eukprot:gene17901-24293_t
METPEKAAQEITDDPAVKLGALYPNLARSSPFLNPLAVAIALLWNADVTVVDVSEGLTEVGASFSKYSQLDEAAWSRGGEDGTHIFQRKWTLGEVVTSVASSGLVIVSLDEEPNVKAADRGLPKVYTIEPNVKSGGRGLHKVYSLHHSSSALSSSRVVVDMALGSLPVWKRNPMLSLGSGGFPKSTPSWLRIYGTQMFQRKWIVGEMATSVASSGLMIVSLDEEPKVKAAARGIPKVFTNVAQTKEPNVKSGGQGLHKVYGLHHSGSALVDSL